MPINYQSGGQRESDESGRILHRGFLASQLLPMIEG